MRPIPLGARGSFALTVAPQHLASVFKDSALPPVLATPVMILVMENAALDAIRSFLEPGESAVGIAVNVRHLAATPVGHVVRGEAVVSGADGRLVEFKLSVRDEIEEIGNGTHERMIIELSGSPAGLRPRASRSRLAVSMPRC
jgi:fluoroacetyl-CoA thioesterase